MKKCYFLPVLLIALVFSTVNAGENLLKDADPVDDATAKKWHQKLKATQEQGENAFLNEELNIWATSPEMIPIDPEKSYILKGSFKSIGEQLGYVFLGFYSYDGNRRMITSANVWVIPQTESVMIAEAKIGDIKIMIEDGYNWKAKEASVIAFDIKDDYQDLPNFKLSPIIEKVESSGDGWEVTLKTPLDFNVSAGTKVRQHLTGPEGMYCAAHYAAAPKDWREYTAKIKGISRSGITKEQFWAGTKYVRVLVITNYGDTSGTKTLFRDIEFKEESYY